MKEQLVKVRFLDYLASSARTLTHIVRNQYWMHVRRSSSSWGTWSGEGDGNAELVMEQHLLCDPFSLVPLPTNSERKQKCDSACHGKQRTFVIHLLQRVYLLICFHNSCNAECKNSQQAFYIVPSTGISHHIMIRQN